MDCFRITSPSIDSLGTLRRRLVPLRTTIWQILCYLRQRSLHWSIFFPPVPKRRNRSRAVLFFPMRWKRNTRSYICSGLHKMSIRKWLIVPWDFTSTGLLLRPVLQTNGLLPLYRTHGKKLLYQRSSQQPIRSRPPCPNAGISIPLLLLCFVLHSLLRWQRYWTLKFPRALLGWKHSQPELPIPLRCLLRPSSPSTTSNRRSSASYVIRPQKTISKMTYHLWMI